MRELVLLTLSALVFLCLALLGQILSAISILISECCWIRDSITRWFSGIRERKWHIRKLRILSPILLTCGLLLALVLVWGYFGSDLGGFIGWLKSRVVPVTFSGFTVAVTSFIVGKPRSGKGLLSMRFLIQELRTTQRPIITNFALRLHPWVNGKGKPQLGLLAYLKREFGQTFNAEKRIFLLSDDEMSKFFLYRAIPKGDGGFELKQAKGITRTMKDGTIIYESFDTSLLNTPGTQCVYLSDEAWKYWGSRNWQCTGEGVLFYSCQGGKLGDDWWIATQHTKQVDLALRNVAQDFWKCRNRAYLKLGFFRQPKKIVASQYEEPPTGTNQESMDKVTFAVDVDGMAQCYDTTQGVGIAGGLAGDVGRAVKGLPWQMIYVLGIAFLALFWFGLNRGLAFFMGKATPSGVLAEAGQVRTNDAFSASVAQHFLPKHGSVPEESSRELLRSNSPPELYVIGVAWLGQYKQRVFLSDGRTYKTGDRAFTAMLGHGAIIDGRLVPFGGRIQREAEDSRTLRYVVPPQVTQYQPY